MTADATRAAAEAAWRAAVSAVLKGVPPESLTSVTADGIEVKPLYPPADAPDAEPWPEPARVVGILPRFDHPEPADGRALASLELDNGATGLVLVGAGSATARGFGLKPTDLAEALDGLPLWPKTVRLEFAPDQRDAAVETLLASAGRNGFAPESLHLDLGFDSLQDAATLRTSVDDLWQRGLTGASLRADGRPHHEAGASEAQELAAVVAAGVAGLRALEPLGLDAALSALSFTLAADGDLLLTVAKMRALRLLWAQVETACGLTPRPIPLHAETSWRMLARRDPHTNFLRGTIATAAAIVGGADSVTVLPFTMALGLPDAFARRLARNIALVLLRESHLAQVADPAAGAGAFKAVTDGLAEKAWAMFQNIEQQGGLAAAMASGAWPRSVAAMREQRMASVKEGRTTLVGVTHFLPPGDVSPAVLLPAAPDASEISSGALPSRRDADVFETSR